MAHLHRSVWLSVGSSCVIALIACGARTGLDGVDDGALGSSSSADASLESSSSTDGSVMVACMTGDFDLAAEVPSVVLLLDNSGSMAFTFENGQSRWSVLSASLAKTLPPIDQTIALGTLVFPAIGSGRDTCSAPSSLDLSPALGNVTPLLSLVKQSRPHGGTPTSDALNVAATALSSLRVGTKARAIVLATDGAPDCNAALDPNTCTCVRGASCRNDANMCLDDARTVSSIKTQAANGIPTYVIGIASAADAQFATILDAMANAGGKPSGGAHAYYAAESSSELDSAFVAIRSHVGACAFLTSSVPSAAGTIDVTADGAPIPNDPDNGWTWGDEKTGEIVLHGTACDAALAAGGHGLTAHVTCGMDAAAPDASDAANQADSSDEADSGDGG